MLCGLVLFLALDIRLIIIPPLAQGLAGRLFRLIGSYLEIPPITDPDVEIVIR